MTHAKQRRQRRAMRYAVSVAEFTKARETIDRLAKHLARLAKSSSPIWPIAEASGRSRPLEWVERVLIQEAVAAHLTINSSHRARRRHNAIRPKKPR